MNALPHPIISFIILTWNSERYLQGCFTSIINKCNEEKIDFEIIVIDNGSRDFSTQVVERFATNHADNFFLIPLNSNKGTTYSRNLGLKKARGGFLCVIDSDTEFGDGHISAILHILGSCRQIGIIAPRLLLPDGSVQHSVKRFPTMIDKLIKIPRILMGFNTKNSDFYYDFPFADQREVDSAISACWFFRRELLVSVGYLDERIFYSPEDVDYCLRVLKSGYVNVYFPNFTVLHHTQQITHRRPLSRTSISHFMGLLYYFRKHGGWLFRPRLLRSHA
jgi:GT2 family glycosyltransferase